jgi:pimeloyl-ACP methyl ester carboxylesterase
MLVAKHLIQSAIAALVCSALLTQAAAAAPLSLAADREFYVGGHYVHGDKGDTMIGQMYVREFVPLHATHRFPIVMIHGGGQTSVNFTATPDGRDGWAQYFVRAGYTVYVVDRPSHGKAGYFPGSYSPTSGSTAQVIEDRFTAPEKANPLPYPQARLHTQWPGTGLAGDRVFDQFFASQVENIPFAEDEALAVPAGVALLDRIGPAILLDHSLGGGPGWAIADARPALVKAIVAMEPSPQPATNNLARGPYGISYTPLTFRPALTSPSDLVHVDETTPQAPGLGLCWKQAEPARQLPNLQKIPIAIMVGEASFLTPFEHCTSQFLTQAGVRHDFIRLADHGMHGNAHMMMLEKNSNTIAAFIAAWLRSKGV